MTTSPNALTRRRAEQASHVVRSINTALADLEAAVVAAAVESPEEAKLWQARDLLKQARGLVAEVEAAESAILAQREPEEPQAAGTGQYALWYSWDRSEPALQGTDMMAVLAAFAAKIPEADGMRMEVRDPSGRVIAEYPNEEERKEAR